MIKKLDLSKYAGYVDENISSLLLDDGRVSTSLLIDSLYIMQEKINELVKQVNKLSKPITQQSLSKEGGEL